MMGDFFQVQRWCFAAIGVAREDTRTNRAVFAVSLLTVLVMKLGTILFAVNHRTEIMLLCDCLGPTFTAYLGLLRQCVLRQQRSTLWQLVDELIALKRKVSPSEVRIIERYNRIDLLHAWTYLVSAMATAALFSGAALWKVISSEPGADWKLPLLMEFPFDIQHPVTFSVFFIWCSVAIVWVVLESVACDSSFGTLCSSVLAHFVIVQRRFELLGTEKVADLASVGALIRYHQYVLWLAKRIIGAYRHIIFNQLLISSILLCMLGFQLVISAGTSIMVVYMVYSLAIIIQITYYCYYGSMLHHESEQVQRAIYNGTWYTADIRTQKLLLVCMMRAGKAVDANFGFTRASLPALKSILNSAGSYVALLLSLLE
ncbi:odorant receptor 47a-like [Anopheles aquasalis]|uniref:odorant receptor 47a-like n=1 Tax=Anopheles aquasalis TaxID=42839 RepID=UPI00215AC9D4|nr:odorant receptor 47a-like [Anopheles aquasalis]